MFKPNNAIEILPIPWMKQKLESIYDISFYGRLHLMYKPLDSSNNTYIDPIYIISILDNLNILVDNFHKIYLYLPLKITTLIEQIIITFKKLFNNNVIIIIGGYKDEYQYLNKSNLIGNLYNKFPNLTNLVDSYFLIDSTKQYEIFTSLSDTQSVFITLQSTSSISATTLNFHLSQKNPINTNHISFVELIDESKSDKFVDYYLKGLTNKNNNFNYKF